MGNNCELCADGYYSPSGMDHSRYDACQMCLCDVPGSTGLCIKDSSLQDQGIVSLHIMYKMHVDINKDFQYFYVCTCKFLWNKILSCPKINWHALSQWYFISNLMRWFWKGAHGILAVWSSHSCKVLNDLVYKALRTVILLAGAALSQTPPWPHYFLRATAVCFVCQSVKLSFLG